MLKQPEMTKNGSVVKLSVTVIQYYTYSVLKYTFQATNPALGIFKQVPSAAYVERYIRTIALLQFFAYFPKIKDKISQTGINRY